MVFRCSRMAAWCITRSSVTKAGSRGRCNAGRRLWPCGNCGGGWQVDCGADRCFEPGAPALGTKLVHAVEHLAQSMHREEFQHLGGRADEGWLAAAAHADDLVAKLRHVRQGVSDDNDGHPVVGQASKQAHDLPVGALVQPAGNLVEQQQAGAVENLTGQAGAFLLPAAERADALVEPIEEIDAARRLVHCRVALGSGGIRRQPKLCRVVERLAHVSCSCEHVLLRHEGDVLSQWLGNWRANRHR